MYSSQHLKVTSAQRMKQDNVCNEGRLVRSGTTVF